MQTTDFVQSYFDAWNHRDPKAVADHLAADGLYLDVPENSQRTHDELIVSLKHFFSRNRHEYELIGDIMRGSNTIAFQYRMTPRGELERGATRQPMTGAEFMTLHGDAAMTITDYYGIADADSPADTLALTSTVKGSCKYAKSGLSDKLLEEYKSRLDKVMTCQHAYLQSDLTLPKLASAIDCSVNHLSQVINSGFGMSFFDYISRFRIDHAKHLLTVDNGQHDAVLNIAFTVGFNSNSAFYSAFKKCVGQTPAQYRRTTLQNCTSPSALLAKCRQN